MDKANNGKGLRRKIQLEILDALKAHNQRCPKCRMELEVWDRLKKANNSAHNVWHKKHTKQHKTLEDCKLEKEYQQELRAIQAFTKSVYMSTQTRHQDSKSPEDFWEEEEQNWVIWQKQFNSLFKKSKKV